MSRIISKDCPRCGVNNTVDLDELKGQPLANENKTLVQYKPIELDDNPLLLECESCRGPVPFTSADQ